ncbi:hypothetical protein [Arthrobacter sp. PsM3]|uniref:hypothetical protein n=1 Tax=Arthrobacter sp. PsM3 TaxID=3030531 RepID=UPI0034616EDE
MNWAPDALQHCDTSVSVLAHQLGVSWHTVWHTPAHPEPVWSPESWTTPARNPPDPSDRRRTPHRGTGIPAGREAHQGRPQPRSHPRLAALPEAPKLRHQRRLQRTHRSDLRDCRWATASPGKSTGVLDAARSTTAGSSTSVGDVSGPSMF